jgi:ATP-dependent Clp protease protease subunit
MDKFWRWVTNKAGESAVRTLYLEGYIAESSWFDDDVTPKQFKSELYGSGSDTDDIIVKIHSPGGDCFAAAQIYNMLKEYPGKVSVHVDGLAASAASVIAMAGDEVCVSPVSVIMIHNPAMLIAGEVADLQVGINLLSEVKESIINAYHDKTGLSRIKIAHMMEAATPSSPSVTSAFQGCLFSPSSLFLLKTVPSMVGLLKVMESPLVARLVAGILKITR